MPLHPPKGRGAYANSHAIPVEQSKAEIMKLLREYGVDAASWVDNFQTGATVLEFAVDLGNGKALKFRIIPAAFKAKHRTWDPGKGKSVVTEAPNYARSMRLLYHWLKTKLEAITYGLTALESEFLSEMIVRDSHGDEVTAGELVLDALEKGGGRLALEAPKRRSGVIEVQP